jgi:hypothetical protein
MTFSMMTSLVTTAVSHADMSHLLPHAQASGTLAHFCFTPSWICFWRFPCESARDQGGTLTTMERDELGPVA